jgi:dihydrolipoamide dehydrogenase
MAKNYDVVVIGAGPGGYVAAIRASQLGKKVAIIEKEHLGGVCLNKGCIPTKAVLKAAQSVHELAHFKELGIQVQLEKLDGAQAVKRSKKIASKISQGVGFLMKKNKIDVLMGEASFTDAKQVIIKGEKGSETISAAHFIIATGAKYRTFPGLEHDGKNIIGAWEAVRLEQLPKKVGIIGAGAIGVEFAYFWNAFGVEVEIFELQKHLLPIEDEESSIEIEKAYKKLGIKLNLGVEKVSTKGNAKGAEISWTDKGKPHKQQFDKVLLAVGMEGSFEGLNLDKIGVKTERGFIQANQYCQTDLAHIYAIGDVSGPPLLAHAASHEGVLAAEHLCGKTVHAIDPLNIPGCTYCQPQVASVGETERALKARGAKYKVGKLPFMANGKAIASQETTGFVKVLMGEHGEMLGAHIVGAHATEMIHEYTLFRTMEGIDEEIYATVHPHPTLGEWLAEAVMAADKRALNF